MNERSGISNKASSPLHGVPHRPTGTVTFLFSDIEGSTQMWENNPHIMAASFVLQENVMRDAMAQHGGYVYKMIGDAFQVAFGSAPQALAAAVDAQRALLRAPWQAGGQLKVRMSLHTGITEEREDDYVGPTLNRAARLLAAGSGGQILLNETTVPLLQEQLGKDVTLLDLGQHYLKDLVQPEHIYQVVASGLPDRFPPLRTCDTIRLHLPVTLTPFVGREMELKTINTLFQNPLCRLITIVGMGGCGKTRLAIQAAAHCPHFVDGIYFIDLTSAYSESDLVNTIATVVGLSFLLPESKNAVVPEIKQQLLSYFSIKQTLLILDNFEQLTANGEFLEELITATSNLRLIVTSRERLNLPPEWVIPLEGLPYQEQQKNDSYSSLPAEQLFLQTAQRGGIEINRLGTNGAVVSRICQIVAGNPLALEMAASWLRVMPCDKIAEAIEKDFDFLSVPSKTIPERHRSQRAVFDYSWTLLSQEERTIAAQLSYFQSPFRFEAAAAVVNVSLPTLMALTDKSILKYMPDDRFCFHPMIRQYLNRKLQEEQHSYSLVAQQHTVYYSQWMQSKFGELKGKGFLMALETIRKELTEVLHAHQEIITKCNCDLLRQSLLGLILFCEMNDQRFLLQTMVGLFETLLLQLLGNNTDIPRTIAEHLDSHLENCDMLALTAAALQHFSSRTGIQTKILPLQHELLAWIQELPDSLMKGYAILIGCIGRNNSAESHTEALTNQSVRIFQQFGEEWDLAITYVISADGNTFGEHSHTLSISYYQTGLEIFNRLGNKWGKALCLVGLAEWSRRNGLLEEAYQMGKESLSIFSQMRNMERILMNRLILANILEEMQNDQEARFMLESNQAYLQEIGDQQGIAFYQERLDQLMEKTTTIPQ
ncbi:MAG: adenylate/guanylate cyclase domain-containing protein [Anaerolineae bacterium]|jgi:class 3 adenylate cyclase|nr:adenylate/guanylate cyclase domain-containing protein [Anaerolineae bacterium]